MTNVSRADWIWLVSASMLIFSDVPSGVAWSRLKVTPLRTSVMSLVSRVIEMPSSVNSADCASWMTLVKLPELSVTPSSFMMSSPDVLE